ncbi:hypothetical protein BH20ACT2_BH20ACT2_15120 [soil metagenome]
MPTPVEILLEELPAAHVLALCLRGAGAADEAIAAQLGVEVVAVPPLVEVGTAKLRMVVTWPEPDPDGS